MVLLLWHQLILALSGTFIFFFKSVGFGTEPVFSVYQLNLCALVCIYFSLRLRWADYSTLIPLKMPLHSQVTATPLLRTSIYSSAARVSTLPNLCSTPWGRHGLASRSFDVRFSHRVNTQQEPLRIKMISTPCRYVSNKEQTLSELGECEGIGEKPVNVLSVIFF